MNTDNGLYKKWVITLNSDEQGLLLDRTQFIVWLEKHCDKYCFRAEVGSETGRLHYQCAVKLKIRKRKKTFLTNLDELCYNKKYIQTARMFGTWEENVSYISKEETGVGPVFSNCPYYTGMDIEFLNKIEKRYPWQSALIDELLETHQLSFKTPDDRKIYWITDKTGNSGKSKFTKWLVIRYKSCVKVPFGTASQLRSSLIEAGPQLCYIIDIPRTLGRDDDINSLISVVEDLKNGFLVSSMYGKNKTLIMNPPHVVVFSNQNAPFDSMSSDRWIEKEINKYNKEFTDDFQIHPAIS